MSKLLRLHEMAAKGACVLDDLDAVIIGPDALVVVARLALSARLQEHSRSHARAIAVDLASHQIIETKSKRRRRNKKRRRTKGGT